MDKEIKLITLRNQFDRTDREMQLVPYNRKSLLDIKNEFLPSDIYFTTAVNGQVIPDDQLALCIPQEGDCIVFTPKVEIAAGAAAIAGYVAAAVGSALAVSTLACVVYCAVYALVYLAGMALLMGLGMLVSSLFAPSSEVGAGDRGSQLYSWNPATTNQQGGSIPKMYGKSVVYGNVISVYTETINDDMFLNILINVNLGPVNKISEFKINDQNSSLFDGVTFETRYGYINQPAVLNFNNTKVEYNMERLVKYDTPEEYVTVVGDFDQIEVEVSFLKGLYAFNSDGNIENHSVKVKIEVINVEDPTINILLTHDTSTDSAILGNQEEAWIQPGSEVLVTHWSLGIWIRDLLGLLSIWKEFEDGGNEYTDHYEGEIIFLNYSEAGNYYVFARWRWLEAGVQANTETTFNNYFVCKENSTDRVTKTFSAPIPRKGKYTVKVTRLSEDTSDTKVGSEMSITCVRLIYNDDFSYPRCTLIGIKALASDQLSGSLGFSCILEGSLIRVYSGAVWTVEYNNNPAWVCYDVLTQPVFYDPDYVCIINGELVTWFRCKLSHTSNVGNTPPNTTYWQQSEGPGSYEIWSQTGPTVYTNWLYPVHYSINTYVENDSVFYRCIVDHLSDVGSEPGTGASWETYWVNYYEELVYVTDTYVKYNGKVYRCILGHNWSASIVPGESSGVLYWVDCGWYTGRSYKDINDSGIVRYDGIDPSKLDHAAFKLWADFCDTLVDDGSGTGATEKRFVFNGGYDSEFSLWEAALRVCQMSRAMLYWNGNQISVVIDQAGTPVQLFTSGNIIADSFEEAFIPYEDRAGEIEISFINEENGYERDTFTIFNTTLDKPTTKAALQLLGVTKPSQAWRTGQFLLLCNQYLKRTIKFKADIDAIACTIGDIINFQHDVPKWGLAGGRVVSATANSVTIDTEVTIEVGNSYSIMVRLSTDVLVTKTVTNAPGIYSVLTVSTPFTVTPSLYDVYSFGEAGVVTKPFRVQSVERAEDQIITISCLEYNANVYSVDTGTPVVPDTDYTPYDPISPVTDLLLKEVVYFDKSGNIIRQINVSFKKPNNILYKEAIVYYTKNSGPMVQAGVTTDTKFIISGCAPLDVYTVFICSRSWSGITLSANLWAAATITISASTPDVIYITDYIIAGLEIYNQGNDHEFTGKDCKFVWRPVSTVIATDIGAGEEDQGAGNTIPGIWFLDYEVQIYDTSGTLRRIEYTTATEYTYTYEKNCEDSTDGIALYTFEIRVKARDTLGHISATAATLIVTNSLPNPVVNLQATPVISGVCFTWNKNTDSDFDCYYVRTAIALVFGDWKKVTDNAHTRSLSDAEMTASGSDALITIEVQAMDVFGQVSTTETVGDNAATISDNLFQFLATKSGGTGNVSDLYDGARSIGGLTI